MSRIVDYDGVEVVDEEEASKQAAEGNLAEGMSFDYRRLNAAEEGNTQQDKYGLNTIGLIRKVKESSSEQEFIELAAAHGFEKQTAKEIYQEWNDTEGD